MRSVNSFQSRCRHLPRPVAIRDCRGLVTQLRNHVFHNSIDHAGKATVQTRLDALDGVPADNGTAEDFSFPETTSKLIVAPRSATTAGAVG